MTYLPRRTLLAAIAAFALSAACAQAAEPAPAIDLSGVWQPDFRKLFTTKATPSLTPKAARAQALFKAGQKKGENLQTQEANCVPPGLPRSMAMPYPIEFLQTAGKITVVMEAYSLMRRVFLDGRKLPDDPDLTFQGSSVGQWRDGALEVDSVGFDPQIWYVLGVAHGPQMRIHETVRLVQPDRLQIVTTVTDPGVLAAPYQTTLEYARHRDWDIKEYVCQQNNHDSADAKGRAGMKLN